MHTGTTTTARDGSMRNDQDIHTNISDCRIRHNAMHISIQREIKTIETNVK